jgi:hypothetical protein
MMTLLVIMATVFACIAGVQLATGRALVWWDAEASRSNRPVLYWQSVGAMSLVVLLLVIMMLKAA